MAVALFMEWGGLEPEQYDSVRKLVDWEGEVAPGGLFHVAAFTDRVLRVVDLGESAETFQAFVAERLTPGVRQLGLPGEPLVEVHPVHAVFNPGVPRV